MIWFLFAIAIVTLIFLGLRMLAKTNAKTLIRFFKRLAIMIGATLLAVIATRMILSGKGHFIWIGLLGLLPWLKRVFFILMMRYASSSFQNYFKGAQNDLSFQEACDILGIGPEIDEKIIRQAWKKKIQAAHPDKGGAIEDAKNINLARDILMRYCKK